MAEAPIIIKKKKSHAHAHHGGSWKVAYADFVTAMWAFFMVMWIMGLSDDIKQKIQGYFNDPLGFMKNQPKAQSVFSVRQFPKSKPTDAAESKSKVVEAEKQQTEAKDLKKKIDKEISKTPEFRDLMKHVEVTQTPEGIRIELLESTGAVFFDSGRSEIKPDALQLIKKIAGVLGPSGRKMILEGHTDAKPYAGTGFTNWDLSTQRALSLQHALIDGGVSEEQVMNVRGCAATELRRPDAPFDYSNRRVSILLPFDTHISTKLELPKVEEKSRVDGMFRQPIEVVPPRPDVTGGQAPAKKP